MKKRVGRFEINDTMYGVATSLCLTFMQNVDASYGSNIGPLSADDLRDLHYLCSSVEKGLEIK